MSKGLQALERIVESHYDKETEDIQIVKRELERLEELEKAFDSLVKESETLGKMLSKEIEKNRAFEVIKEKDVDVGWLKRAKDLHQYNNGMGINSYKALTQEEYDLFEEVLL